MTDFKLDGSIKTYSICNDNVKTPSVYNYDNSSNSVDDLSSTRNDNKHDIIAEIFTYTSSDFDNPIISHKKHE